MEPGAAIREAAAAGDYGAVIALCRRERAMSQRRLGALCGYDQSAVSRLERRGPLGTYDVHVLRRVAEVLDLPPNLLGLADTAPVDRATAHRRRPVIARHEVGRHDLMASEWTTASADALSDTVHAAEVEPMTVDAALRLAHVWLVADPPQALHLQAGRRVGQQLADETSRRVARLRRMDDYIGGADLQPAVTRELAATTTTIREGSYGDDVGRQLLTGLGDLCQLAGRTATDVGHDQAAAHYFATGTAAAHAARDVDLAGECLSTLAYHLANTGTAADAVLLAQSAVTGSRDVSGPTSRALHLDRLAWAHARAHNRRQTERALGLAEEAFADRTPDDEPEWAYWLTPDELDVMAGRCFTELGLPELARPRLERALGDDYADRPREAALYMSWLAEAELQAGDVDRAAELAGRVLDLAGHTASQRVDDRVHHLGELLHEHDRHPAVDAFEQHYRASPLGQR